MTVREEPRNYYGNLEEVSLGKQEKFMGNLTTDLDDKLVGSSTINWSKIPEGRVSALQGILMDSKV